LLFLSSSVIDIDDHVTARDGTDGPEAARYPGTSIDGAIDEEYMSYSLR